MRKRRFKPPEYLWGHIPDYNPPASSPSKHERKEHAGRVPQVGVPSGPRQTVAPEPGSPADEAGLPVAPSHGTPPGRVHAYPSNRYGADPSSDYYPQELIDLITPGPTAKEIAESAARLGVKPKDESLLDKVGGAVDTVAEDFSKGVKEVTQRTEKLAKLPEQVPKERVDNILGQKTLGTPTIAQIAGAAVRGQLRTNRRGKVTVPETRGAARRLQATRDLYAKTARPDTSGLSPEEKAVIPYVLKAHEKYPDIPVSVLMAQIRQESGFDPTAHSSAGAEGLSQFIPSTAAAYGVKYGTGRKEQQSQVTGQAALLHGAGFAENPTGALEVYTGGSEGHGYSDAAYNNPVLQGAKDYAALDKPSIVPPKVLAALKQAKTGAQKVGIPTKAGDVEPGPQPNTVFVRADAKGFVDWAKALLGTQEGSRLQLKWAAQSGISAADPWCAAFITAGVARRGLTPPPGSANSQSWMTWDQGTNIGTDISKAKPGDIIVIGAGDHIGLYTGGGNMIAGNWSDEVAEYPVASDTRGVEGIIRPRFSGKKVAVQESTVLPGAAIGSDGTIVSGPAGASGIAGASPAGQKSEARPAVSLGSILTPGAASAPLPAAFQQFQEGATPEAPEGGELGGLIEAILRRRRV